MVEASTIHENPEAFGKWPGAVGSVPESEQLFDRAAVAALVNGTV